MQENLRVSHKHNGGDGVLEKWLPFPGLTKPTLGISKQIKRKSLDKGNPSRVKGNKEKTWFREQSNKINSRKEIYLNETISMKEAGAYDEQAKRDELKNPVGVAN